MSLRRFGATFGVEISHTFRRPLFIVLAVILLLSGWGLSTGNVQISSGDSSVGGTKAWITSEFAQTQMMTYIVLLPYAFFIAIGAGLTLIRDRETKVDSLLYSTPLTAGEYVWGRYLAIMVGFGVLLAWQVAVNAFFNHVVPNANANEIRGPFSLASYALPVLTIGLPFLVFYAGLALYVGQRTQNGILVFFMSVALLLVCGFFLWTWSPSWLDWRINRLLQVLDPSGYRWLNEALLKVDRGVTYYNKAHVAYDGLFWINRLAMIVIGLGSVVLTQRSVARAKRGIAPSGVKRGFAFWKAAGVAVRLPGAVVEPDAPAPGLSPWPEGSQGLAALAMATKQPSFLGTVRAVAGAEVRELSRQKGLYVFIPLILIQALGNALIAVGAFDTPILLTPGITAVQLASQVSGWICLLLMFYTVESLERERAADLAPIVYSTPIKTGALLAGKALANALVGGAVLIASLLACFIAVLVQHTVPFSVVPFVLVWGVLLIPTFLAWTAFVTAAYAWVGNRYAAYGIALAALIFTLFKALFRQINWAFNWPLWGALRWSDLGFFETDRTALLWNRIGVLGLAVFLTVLAVRLFARRGPDAVQTIHRLSPRSLVGSAVKLSPYAAVPAIAVCVLMVQVHDGLNGGTAKKAGKDYWAKNLKTWMNAPLPDIGRADIALKLDPAKHFISSKGTLTLRNGSDSTLARFPLSGAQHWEHLAWTMNGKEYEPETTEHLYVIEPPLPLAPGDSVVVGWSFDGRYPKGVTKNGENTDEFILPSGVVLTGFTPSFMPVLGFLESVGESKDNKTEPRRYPRDYWKGITRAGFGATAWFPARIAVTGPEAYTLNSVGVCTSNTVKDGWRTQVWETTDHPVKILNVVCGRWREKEGHGTTIYYSAVHPYNVNEMSTTLDAARRYYSEWFLPYPWKELKLSEFPALAGYAQGFGTNITFSENIGFLTRNDDKTDATFLVTAHEAAHQWWGNILTPADGPNGDFLSEGAAHFSTMLLFNQVKGPAARMEFAKGIESRYNDNRRVDDERAMYDVDGKRDADNTVLYDRGGWVFWMLYDYLGHDRAIAGYRNFIQTWSVSRDHPALQDFVAAMRPYAQDPVAYDAFVKQWMEDKVVPEYRVSEAKRLSARSGYSVTATVRNIGTGIMPVEVAAAAGERWTKAKDGSGPASTPNPAYHDARTTITLGAGESRTVTLHCDFKPERVVVDPDVRVLQLRRKLAVATL